MEIRKYAKGKKGENKKWNVKRHLHSWGYSVIHYSRKRSASHFTILYCVTILLWRRCFVCVLFVNLMFCLCLSLIFCVGIWCFVMNFTFCLWFWCFVVFWCFVCAAILLWSRCFVCATILFNQSRLFHHKDIDIK